MNTFMPKWKLQNDKALLNTKSAEKKPINKLHENNIIFQYHQFEISCYASLKSRPFDKLDAKPKLLNLSEIF